MINIAIIGCGHWGPNHVRNFNSLPGSRVTVAVDIYKAALSRITEMFPRVRVEQDYQEILEDSNVDAVVISTPTRTHYQIVYDALMANKHVLCEKPLCTDTLEAQELVELAHARNLVLMTGHIFLFNSGIQQLKKLLDSGKLGKLHYMSAKRTNLGPIRTDVNAAYDLASHDISIFNWLLGAEPELVSAMGASFLKNNLEDVVFISLKYPRNVFANIHASWLDPKKVRQICFVGSKKMITWDDLELSLPITIYDKGANTKQEYTNFGEFLRINMWEGDVVMPKVSLEEPLKSQNSFFLDAVKNGNFPDRSNGNFAVGVVRVLEAVVKSARYDGRPVEIRE
jgi:predicted dehydrogenase